MTSLVIVHAQGVYRPLVHANSERDIGNKRSSDEWAQTPHQDSSSGNTALLIGSGSYGCPVLQRFRTCTAYSVCSCPLQLSHPGRLITQEYLLNSSCFQQGYHNAPHGAHRTCLFPSIRLASCRFSPFGLSAFRVAASGSSGSPVTLRPTTGFPSPPGRS